MDNNVEPVRKKKTMVGKLTHTPEISKPIDQPLGNTDNRKRASCRMGDTDEQGNNRAQKRQRTMIEHDGNYDWLRGALVESRLSEIPACEESCLSEIPKIAELEEFCLSEISEIGRSLWSSDLK